MDEKLLDLLVCPITLSKLKKEGEFLVSAVGPVRYPIKDGIPVLLPDAAELPAGVKSPEELKARLAKGNS